MTQMPVTQGPSNNRLEVVPDLRVMDLRKSFYQRAGLRGRTVIDAVDGVSFDVLPGKTLGIVGESGCGKSTLARLLVGLTTPSGGSVSFRGDNLVGMNRDGLQRFRRHVQMIFQDPESSLSPRLRARDVIKEAWIANTDIVPKGQQDERARELLSLVGLRPGHEDRYPSQFSGGQRQRLGIARALAVEPRVLVCDEPVSSLDVSVQAQIINLFQGLQRDLGVSLVFIAHDLSVVRHIADEVAVMHDGKIVESGATDSVYDDPSHPYTRSLLDAIPLPDPSVGSFDRGDRSVSLSRTKVPGPFTQTGDDELKGGV